MVIATYNLLSWELNFTNTKANLKMFFPDREYTRLQRAESVIHSSWDLSLFMVIKEGRWDKQISVIWPSQESQDGKQNRLSFF